MKTFHVLFCLLAATGFSVVSAQNTWSRRSSGSAATTTPQENARIELFREQTERLNEQVNAMKAETRQLDQRLTQTETMAAAITTLRTENANLRVEINDLRDELAKVKADRETLRKQIADDLAGRIAKLIDKSVAQQVAAQVPARETGRLHVVESGQTLSEIARAYKTTAAAIMKANNMSNADRLSIGQELFIPEN